MDSAQINKIPWLKHNSSQSNALVQKPRQLVRPMNHQIIRSSVQNTSLNISQLNPNNPVNLGQQAENVSISLTNIHDKEIEIRYHPGNIADNKLTAISNNNANKVSTEERKKNTKNNETSDSTNTINKYNNAEQVINNKYNIINNNNNNNNNNKIKNNFGDNIKRDAKRDYGIINTNIKSSYMVPTKEVESKNKTTSNFDRNKFNSDLNLNKKNELSSVEMTPVSKFKQFNKDKNNIKNTDFNKDIENRSINSYNDNQEETLNKKWYKLNKNNVKIRNNKNENSKNDKHKVNDLNNLNISSSLLKSNKNDASNSNEQQQGENVSNQKLHSKSKPIFTLKNHIIAKLKIPEQLLKDLSDTVPYKEKSPKIKISSYTEENDNQANLSEQLGLTNCKRKIPQNNNSTILPHNDNQSIDLNKETTNKRPVILVQNGKRYRKIPFSRPENSKHAPAKPKLKPSNVNWAYFGKLLSLMQSNELYCNSHIEGGEVYSNEKEKQALASNVDVIYFINTAMEDYTNAMENNTLTR